MVREETTCASTSLLRKGRLQTTPKMISQSLIMGVNINFPIEKRPKLVRACVRPRRVLDNGSLRSMAQSPVLPCKADREST